MLRSETVNLWQESVDAGHYLPVKVRYALKIEDNMRNIVIKSTSIRGKEVNLPWEMMWQLEGELYGKVPRQDWERLS